MIGNGDTTLVEKVIAFFHNTYLTIVLLNRFSNRLFNDLVIDKLLDRVVLYRNERGDGDVQDCAAENFRI